MDDGLRCMVVVAPRGSTDPTASAMIETTAVKRRIMIVVHGMT